MISNSGERRKEIVTGAHEVSGAAAEAKYSVRVGDEMRNHENRKRQKIVLYGNAEI